MSRLCLARAGALVVAALLAFGCGSDGSSEESQRLSPELADDLASQSEAVASTFEQGDGCTARNQAIALRDDVRTAIDDGEVPASLRPEMRRRANDLVASIPCEPPPQPQPPPQPPPTTEEYEEEEDD